jgi:nucleoid-associated protein YgaU
MGNFEKLSVLVIVVIIVMILVVALYTWTDDPDAGAATTDVPTTTTTVASGAAAMNDPLPPAFPPAPPNGTRTPMATIPGTMGPVAPPTTGVNPMTDGRDGAIPPAVPPTPETARVETPAEPRVHIVASGDNLTKIAKKYFNSTGQRYVDAIAAANPGLEPNRLRVNQKLQIPADVPAATRRSSDGVAASERPAASSGGSGPKAGSVYTVRRGDKLPDIARRAYGSSENWYMIWLENFTTIRDPDQVASGTKLKIPHVNN